MSNIIYLNTDSEYINDRNTDIIHLYKNMIKYTIFLDTMTIKPNIHLLHKQNIRSPLLISPANKNNLSNCNRFIMPGTINLKMHGIPRLDKPDAPMAFFPTDEKREFIKVPLHKEQDECNKLRKHLEKIDKWKGSNIQKDLKIKITHKRKNREIKIMHKQKNLEFKRMQKQKNREFKRIEKQKNYRKIRI